MAGGKENARKRAAENGAAAAEAAGPRDVITLEVTQGPSKGTSFKKQARRHPEYHGGMNKFLPPGLHEGLNLASHPTTSLTTRH